METQNSRALFRKQLLHTVLCLGFGWALSCGSPPPPAPSAVIEIDPPAICKGDEYTTSILLDASASAPRLTLVPSTKDPEAPPLLFHWSFTGAEFRIETGDQYSERLTLLSAGNRPLHVKLEVENPEGGRATAERTLGITLPPCPEAR